jgi:MraZ protein
VEQSGLIPAPSMATVETINAPSATVPTVTYIGQFVHGLDEKRRLQIPSRWRPASGEMQWMAMLWPKGGVQGVFINVLTLDSYNRVMAKLNAESLKDENASTVMRYFSRNSGELVMDKAGRVVVPEHLARQAGVDKEAIVVGMWERFEIWAPERYNPAAAQEDAVVTMNLNKYL